MDLITIPVPGGSAEAYVARPDSGSGPGVLLFMDALGVRPRLAEMADRIASWGYVVLVPNVFYRSGTADEVAPHADLREQGEREAFFGQAMPRIGALTTDLALVDIDAYLETLHGLEGVTGDHVGVLGYCMGARLAIRAATSHPDEVAACAGFHGGGLVTGDDDSPHLGIPSARAEFAFGHADNDGSMPPEAVATLGETLASSGLTALNEVYEGAAHGYSMDDTSMYDAAATERSFATLEALFARTLR